VQEAVAGERELLAELDRKRAASTA
jgi:hypothetical protein